MLQQRLSVTMTKLNINIQTEACNIFFLLGKVPIVRIFEPGKDRVKSRARTYLNIASCIAVTTMNISI